MSEKPIPYRKWDVYRDTDGNPVTLTYEQCAAVLHAFGIVEDVRRVEGHRPLFADRSGEGVSWHAEIAKSCLLGRMLHDGKPPLAEKPPTIHAAPAYHLVEGPAGSSFPEGNQ